MPFGLRNASCTFQRFMDNIFSELDCTFVYIDDILVFSENYEKHMLDLRNVCNLLAQYDLKVSIDKCTFDVESLDFLGHAITSAGIKPTDTKVIELRISPQPDDYKSLRRFLGMSGFYRKLIPNYSHVVCTH